MFKKKTIIFSTLLFLSAFFVLMLVLRGRYRSIDIFDASEKGRLVIVKSLVYNNRSLVHARRHKDSYTPLMLAALKGQIDVAKFLIDNGSDVNSVSKNGHTPLMFATINGHIEVCKLLIDNGAYINSKDRNGSTPLSVSVGYAYESGNSEILELLIDKGGDVNVRSSMGETLIHGAGWAKRPEIAELLTVRYGLDINAQDANLRTPLWVASLTGNIEAVRTLIALGARVDVKDVNRSTALHIACEEGHAEVATLLLKAGTDVNIKNKLGYTPLDIAFAKQDNKLVQTLREYGSKGGSDVIDPNEG